MHTPIKQAYSAINLDVRRASFTLLRVFLPSTRRLRLAAVGLVFRLIFGSMSDSVTNCRSFSRQFRRLASCVRWSELIITINPAASRRFLARYINRCRALLDRP